MILDKIFEHKKKALDDRKKQLSFQSLFEKGVANFPHRDFWTALKQEGMSLIAEIKKASPSAGLLREDFEPGEIAASFEQAGAAAISVLTEEKYFQGSLDDLTTAQRAAALPILRKDFIFDEYQVLESRVFGADAVLLIARLLPIEKLHKLHHFARQLDLDVLVEVHDRGDLRKALEIEALFIGINNRDLDTLEVDLTTTERLIDEIPEGKIIVSESGINSKEEVRYLGGLGVDAILVGEALMRGSDIGAKVRELIEA